MKHILFTASVFALTSFAAPSFAVDNGFYAGVSLGYSHTDVDGEVGGPSFGGVFTDDENVKGADFGLLAGYRHYFNNFFVGLEGEASLSGADASNVFTIPGLSLEKNHSLGVYVKPGYQFTEQFAVFATLGWKWNQYEMKIAGVSDKETFDGVAFGGGVEYAFTPHIRLAGEYNRVALGNKTYDYGGGDYMKFDGDENIVKVALKYHF